jgi:hypothetical protein
LDGSGNSTSAASLIGPGTLFLVLTVYALACLGAGLMMFRLLCGARTDVPMMSRAAFLAVAFLLGLGALGQAWTLVALAGWFRLKFTLTLTAALAAVALWRGRLHAAEIIGDVRHATLALRKERWEVSLLLLLVLGWMVFTFTSLGRPFSGDGLALHMLVPKMVAESGVLLRTYFQSANEFYGVLGEMNYAALIQFGSADAAQMLTYVAGLGLAVVLVDICAFVGIGLRGQILALTMAFTSTAVLSWIGEGKIDLIAAALGFAGLRFVPPCGDKSKPCFLIIGGLLIGCAITAKLILGFSLAIIAAVLLGFAYVPDALLALRGKSWRCAAMPFVGACAFLSLGTFIGLLPHFVKNWVLLGEPLAPLFSPGRADWLVEDRWYTLSVIARIRMLYPFVLTFGEYWAQFGTLSVLVLAFLPLSFFLAPARSPWRSPLVAVTTASWVALAAWAAMQGDKVVTRYILPALLLCIPLAAAAAEQASCRCFRPRWLGTATLACCFVALIVTGAHSVGLYFFPSKALKVIVGAASPCERGLLWCAPMDLTNRLAPQGARVLSLSSYRYYLRPDLILCSYDFRSSIFPGSSIDERWHWFYNEGFSFILPDISTPQPFAGDVDNAPAWVIIKRYQPDNPMGPIAVSYNLSAGGPSTTPTVSCRELAPGDWRVIRTAS